MRLMKRWGVMTLVALLVLGTMGAALADDDVDAESAQVVPEEGSYPFTPEWAKDVVAFVFYWGYGEEAEGEEAEGEEAKAVPGDEVVDCAPVELMDTSILQPVDTNGDGTLS